MRQQLEITAQSPSRDLYAAANFQDEQRALFHCKQISQVVSPQETCLSLSLFPQTGYHGVATFQAKKKNKLHLYLHNLLAFLQPG